MTAKTALAIICALLAPPALGAELVGEWWTPGFNARVRIEPCGDALCGRIVWMWDETPKGIADTGPLIGKPVIEKMRAVAPSRWAEGRLYNPEDGRDYKGTLRLRSQNHLVVEGCVLFVCQTQLWRRADASRCPPVAVP